MYTCLLVDDEPLALDVIEHYLDKLDQFHVVKKCTNGLEAFNYLSAHKVDLLFLDIEMPEFTGLDLLRSLNTVPQVIITTAYREYAVDGFELNVLDYLVKPIRLDRFMKAIDKFLEKSQLKPESQTITIRADRKNVQVAIADILYIEGLKDYVKVVLKDRQLLTKKTVGQIFEDLDSNHFFRIHKSFIVSRSAITSYTAQEVEIGENQLPVGRSYRDEFLKKVQA